MALRISARSELPPFMVMDVVEKAEAMQASTHEVLRMEMGQPSSLPPQAALAALQRYIDDPPRP